jgi:hypothetical protein
MYKLQGPVTTGMTPPSLMLIFIDHGIIKDRLRIRRKRDPQGRRTLLYNDRGGISIAPLYKVRLSGSGYALVLMETQRQDTRETAILKKPPSSRRSSEFAHFTGLSGQSNDNFCTVMIKFLGTGSVEITDRAANLCSSLQ